MSSSRSDLIFRDATADDAGELTALHTAAAAALTARFGEGPWSKGGAVGRIEPPAHTLRRRVGIQNGRIVSTVRLQTKKPWAIYVRYFTPVERPIYLIGMAVAVAAQGRGRGRAALADALEVVQSWPADAIRLDAWDAPAGAGTFYAKCGFSERGRVRYKGTPLVYFEHVLRP